MALVALANLEPPLRRRPALSSLLIVATLPATLTAQATDAAARRVGPQAIVGVVADRATGQPLAGVAVVLRFTGDTAGALTRPSQTLTDEAGRFLFVGLAGGRYEIDVRTLGYRPIVDSIDYRSDLGLLIEAELVAEALELEPLLVVADARSRSLDATGFYERRRRGLGSFVTREDIERRNPMMTSDLLRTMAGVRVSVSGGFPTRRSVRLRGGCVPDVYLDGALTLQPFPFDQLLNPEDIEAIEVYHASELPARFGTTSCGAVLVWTRLPGPGEGTSFTWGRALAALGFISLAWLLTR